MRKLMKRLFAFAAVMLMMVSLIPTVAFAAETKTDEKVAVYIQVPEDWSIHVCGHGMMLETMRLKHGRGRRQKQM